MVSRILLAFLLLVPLAHQISVSSAFIISCRHVETALSRSAFRKSFPLFDSATDHTESSPEILCDLQTFLRLIDAVTTGGAAKIVIQGEECLLNGEIETRRAKKLYSGDVVTFDGSEYNVEEHVALKGYVYKPKKKNR